jgi:hypothetical protein
MVSATHLSKLVLFNVRFQVLSKLVLFNARFQVLSKLVLFNVRFEVLIVVNVGCYAIHCDRELPVFQRNMPASSGYIALKMICSRVLEDFDTCQPSYMA